jgi:hypothetical protein
MDVREQESTQEELLTPDFLRKLEQLSLVAKRVFPGRLALPPTDTRKARCKAGLLRHQCRHSG